MSGDLIKVRLTGPAKVGSRWLKAAEEEVTAEEFAVLEAEGLIDLGSAKAGAAEAAPAAQSFTLAEFEDRVAKTAKLIAEGLVDAAVKDVVTPLEAQLAAAEEERDNQIELVASLRQVIGDLEARLAEKAEQVAEVDTAQPQSATPASKDTPPSEKVAKTAPKKGAAATIKG